MVKCLIDTRITSCYIYYISKSMSTKCHIHTPQITQIRKMKYKNTKNTIAGCIHIEARQMNFTNNEINRKRFEICIAKKKITIKCC